MKILNSLFRKNKIIIYNKNNFIATYKNKYFHITSDHGYGKSSVDVNIRFCIDVIDLKSGMYDVFTYQDVETIEEAIKFALKGSCLVK